MKEEDKYYKKKGLTQLGCWFRYKCDWCGKKIQGDGSDNGFRCSDPECESRKKVKEEPLSDRDQADLILFFGLFLFICVMVGLLMK